MNRESCPSVEVLSRLSAGQLAAAEASTISEHVRSCSRCGATLKQLSSNSTAAGDSIIGVSRAAATSGGGNAPAQVTIEVFVQRLTAARALPDNDLAALNKTYVGAARQDDASALAKDLVQQGKLTRFQAATLYQGKGQNLAIGNYLLLDRLGVGGMGQVFKGISRATGEVFAVKLLTASSSRNVEKVKRFQRESGIAIRVSHPNVVRAFEAGEHEKQHYLVMEYVEGDDLGNQVKGRGPLPFDYVIHCAIQAAQGLSYAHTAGLVHRDIKPGNLMVTKDGKLKVLDLGLARDDGVESADNQAAEGLTQTGQIMGTVDYMAPEQAFKTHLADARADIYGLGCTIYRLLTNDVPYPGESVVERILAHRERPIPSVRQKRQDVPVELDYVLQRMLAKRPEDRQQTMVEVADELQRLLTQPETIQPPASAKPQVVSTPQPVASSAPVAPPMPVTAAKKKTPLLYAAAGFLVIVAGGIVAMALSSGNKADPPDPTPPGPIAQADTKTPDATETGKDSKTSPPMTLESATKATPPVAPVPTPPMPPTVSPVTVPPVTGPGTTPPPVTPNRSTPPSPSRVGPPSGPGGPIGRPPFATPPGPRRTGLNFTITYAQPLQQGAADPKDGEVARAFLKRGATAMLVPEGNAKSYTFAPSAALPANFRLVGLDLSQVAEFSDADMPLLLEGKRLIAINFAGTSISNQALKSMADLPLLELLCLADTRIDNAGMADVARCVKLRQLDISRTNVNGRGIAPLAGLNALQSLGMERLSLNDDELKQLGGLFNLILLGVEETTLTDACLAHLAPLNQLRVLGARGSRISPTSQEQLRQVLPNCVLDQHRAYLEIAQSIPLPVPVRAPTNSVAGTRTSPSVPPLPSSAPSTSPPATSPSTTSAPTSTPQPDKPPRTPVPDDEKLAESRKLILDIFRADIQAAKKPEEKVELAKKLLAHANSMENDPTGMYAVLLEARNHAAEGAEPALVESTCGTLSTIYELERLDLISEIWNDMTRRPANANTAKVIAPALEKYVDEAVELRQFDVARDLSETATHFARQTRDAAIVKKITERGTALKAERQQWDAVEKAREVLKETPDDPTANLIVGKYLCFVEGEWNDGFAALVKSNDSVFKELGEKGIEPPTVTDKLVELGDLWWTKSEKSVKDRKDLQIGAVHWYQQALPNLQGLAKTRVEKRINEAPASAATKTKEVATAAPVTPGTSTTTTRPGTVNLAGNASAASRALAEYFTTRSAWCTVVFADGTTQYLSGRTPVPDREFRVTDISFVNNAPVSDEMLKQLPPIDTLQKIYMSAGSVSETGIAELKKQPRLTEISFSSNFRLNDTICRNLATLTQLEKLRVLGSSVTDQGLQALGSLKNLEEFTVDGSTSSDKGFAVVTNMPKLKRLYLLSCSGMTDKIGATLGTLTELEILSFYGSPVSDAILRDLSKLKKLEVLTFSRSRTTGAGFAQLKPLTNLRTLNLAYLSLQPQSASEFAALPNLVSLYLDNGDIDDRFMAALRLPPSVRTLSMRDSRVTDAGISHVAKFPMLNRVYIGNRSAVSDAAISKVRSIAPGVNITR